MEGTENIHLYIARGNNPVVKFFTDEELYISYEYETEGLEHWGEYASYEEAEKVMEMVLESRRD